MPSILTLQLQGTAVALLALSVLLRGHPYFVFRRFRSGEPVTLSMLAARFSGLLGIAFAVLGCWHQFSDWHLL